MNLTLTGSNLWWLIAAMAALSYAQRAIPFWLSRQFSLDSIQEPLRLVPAAVLSALIFQELFIFNNRVEISPLVNPHLLAGLGAVLAVRFTGRVLPGIAAGMAIYWGLSALL